MDSKASSSVPIVPLISNTSAGPLGIKHLPRLWLKTLLKAEGRLADGYRCGVGGSDETLFTTFGLDGPAFITFVQTQRPDYLALEAYVREHAGDLSPQTIARFNEEHEGFELPDPRGSDWRARFGVDERKAVRLNHLDDWAGAYEQIDALEGPVVPLISTEISGPLGVKHVPRLWWKKLLDAKGKLYEGYRCGVGGFDERCTEALGIDRDAFGAWVKETLPDYLATEAWIREHVPAEKLRDGAAQFNAWVTTFDMPAPSAEKIRSRFPVPEGVTNGIALNNLDDWKSVHEQLRGAVAGV